LTDGLGGVGLVIPDEVLRIGKTGFLERGGLFCGGVGLFENSVDIDSGERGNPLFLKTMPR